MDLNQFKEEPKDSPGETIQRLVGYLTMAALGAGVTLSQDDKDAIARDMAIILRRHGWLKQIINKYMPGSF